ncbi:MAG: penicillin-binding protein [Clostridia bacterium]|nr:penicillin-binding protein [Clostridia bacterium]
MFGKLKNRRTQINIIFIIIFAIMLYRLAVLTLVQGEDYREQALNNRLRKVTEVAKRGDIYDRNGVLVAGSVPGFVVNINGSLVSKSDLNDVSVRLVDLLNDAEETHIEFPIKVDNGKFYYDYDVSLQEWLLENDFDSDETAEDVYAEILRREQIFFEVDPYEGQRLLLLKGISPPISVSKMEYRAVLNKQDFLKSYGIEGDTSAEVAFKMIRDRKEFSIPEDMSDEDAYKILALKHAIRAKGYLKYEPVKVADSVKESTAVMINELGMELPGVSVSIEPIRYYPFKDIGAHILGYMGKISSEYEIQKYVDENGYNRNQIIGKVGIEGNYELDLNGTNGYKYVEVDVLGRLVREVDKGYDGIESKSSIAGKDIVLTIDMDLQKAATAALEKGIKMIQTGGVYDSPWGNYKYKEAFEKAETGAVVVVDVQTGEVLALANYPSYDINLFSTGITSEDWESLQPDNIKNPLAPRPLYNTAALTAAEPGSTYKMITGFAAAQQGMDPYKKIYADGYVQIGNHRFGCWYYNDYGLRHGNISFVEALKVSCNYFFYDISTGYDYHNDRPLTFDMDATKLIEASKRFGLDEESGIEIYESVRGVPDPEKKKRDLIRGLRGSLEYAMEDYFDADVVEDEDKRDEIINEIVSWADENPTRGAIINRLRELSGRTYTEVEPLADTIKYSYFNLMKWYAGDTFNMAIGQGGHEYTPVQIARYIATIANGGYNNELTLIKSVGGVTINKNQFVSNEGMNVNHILDAIKEGMRRVTCESDGTGYSTFKNFPIIVGAKTGTAERMGKIPPADELAYLKENLVKIDRTLSIEQVEAQADVILERRNNELAEMRAERDALTDETEKNALTEEINELVSYDYLSSESTFRAAIKELSKKDLRDSDINYFRDDYDSHGWFVSFAPFDDPEIAVVVLVPQGGHGGYTAPIAREIYAHYFHLYDNIVEGEETPAAID